ncbi:MAG: amino acid-binding protein [Phycisphaeraceae bacterium]|nr:amino acid-binding protein [Phycisphaeraceae bacterium]
MPLPAQKVDVWHATIEDRPGGLAEKLAPLVQAGANLGFAIARRSSDHPETGFVWIAGLKGAKQLAAARGAGFAKTRDLHSVRVEGTDRPGLMYRIMQTLADANVNVRGVSAATVGRRCVSYLALDTTADATMAARLIRKLK